MVAGPICGTTPQQVKTSRSRAPTRSRIGTGGTGQRLVIKALAGKAEPAQAVTCISPDGRGWLLPRVTMIAGGLPLNTPAGDRDLREGGAGCWLVHWSGGSEVEAAAGVDPCGCMAACVDGCRVA